jgi:transposase
MDTEKDLSTATRDELLAIITQQRVIIGELQQTIAQLQKRIEQLEGRASGRKREMPGNKPASTRQEERKTTRKPRPKGFARCRATPTRRVEHKLDKCPDCGTTLTGGWVHKTREVIEIPLVPAEVTEHVLIARQCPVCNQAKVAKMELAGVVAGEQRLGINLVSLIVTLKEEARLPVRAIKWYLRTVHQLELSVGGIIDLCHRVAEKGKRLVEEIRDRIRASPVVHADETGWREDGKNGYAWTFSTPTERYFVRGRRSKSVVKEVLGETCRAILVTDFYAAYHSYPGLHQRCWSHLLRDIHDLTVAYPEDKGLHRWAQGMHKLFTKAKTMAAELAERGADEAERCRAQLKLEQTLLRLCRPHLAKETALQGKLCRRVGRHIKELFVFVSHPGVPADNNAAERSLRHLVISRKISGGTRSEHGSTTKMILATLFGTWRARDLDPLAQCRSLLASP